MDIQSKDVSRLIMALALIAIFVLLLLQFIHPKGLLAEPPEAQWWTALSLIVVLTFSAFALNIWKTGEITEKVEELQTALRRAEDLRRDLQWAYQQDLQERQDEYRQAVSKLEDYIDHLTYIINVFFNSDFKDGDHWKDLVSSLERIDKDLNDRERIIQTNTLRLWSRVAWQQGFKKECLQLREKAVELSSTLSM